MVICLIGVVGCGNKKSLTSNEFRKKLEGKKFTVQDVTGGLDVETTSQALIALNANYQIEYYLLSSDKGVESNYTFNKKRIDNLKIKGYKENEKKEKNWTRYTLLTSKTYSIISKIDKTILYISVDKKHQKEVDDIFNSLGY